MPAGAKIFLLTGPKHSGKTSAASKLAGKLKRAGREIAGILAPSVWREGVLEGFDVMNLATGQAAPLLRRAEAEGRAPDVGPFALCDEGVALGQAALAAAGSGEAEIVFVDEVGPLELSRGGWRPAIDALAALPDKRIVLVVREELRDAVAAIYPDCAVEVLPALPEQAAETI